MRVVGFVVVACATMAGCSATSSPETPQVTKPDLVGKVSSQPGNCFFRDAAGNVFISACP